MLVQNGVLMGLLYGLWYILSLTLAMHLMHGGVWSRPFLRARRREVIGTAIVGVALFGARAVLQYLVYENLWIAVFGMLVGIVAIFQIGYLWYYYHDDSDMGWPLILMIFALLPAGQVVWTTTMTWSFMVNSWFWLTVVQALPVLIFIAAVAFVVAEYFFYQYAEYRNEDSHFASERRVCGWATVFAATLAMVLFVVGVIPGAQIDWQSLGEGEQWQEEQQDPKLEWPEDKTPSLVGEGWMFYNNYLQKPYDDDPLNDYNFGASSIWDDATAEDWYDPDFRARIVRDPALGAADIAWFDCVMGTRVLGHFHASIQGNWPTAINEAKESFIANPELYNQVCQNFFSWLDAAEVLIQYDDGLTDQMYMDPHTGLNVPDVILMETTEHEGWFLVYRFQVKENFAEVKYRLECGYQPTNCSEKMQWTPARRESTGVLSPTKKPDKPDPTKKPGKPDPTKKPGKPDPTKKPDKPDPTPRPKKDSSKGTQGDLVGKQDNPGAGGDTNTGSGSQKSSKHEKESSTNGTHEEYKQKVEEKKQVNEEQKKGGDDNKPAAAPAPEAKVDNNGSTGTGNGSADAATPVQEKAHEADTSNTISDQPGEAWGGPSD